MGAKDTFFFLISADNYRERCVTGKSACFREAAAERRCVVCVLTYKPVPGGNTCSRISCRRNAFTFFVNQQLNKYTDRTLSFTEGLTKERLTNLSLDILTDAIPLSPP